MDRGSWPCNVYYYSLCKAVVLCLLLCESAAFPLFGRSGIPRFRRKEIKIDPMCSESANIIRRKGFQLSASTAIEDLTSVTDDEDFIRMYSNNQSLNDKPIEAKVGVLLLNLGGPEKTADVQGKLHDY